MSQSWSICTRKQQMQKSICTKNTASKAKGFVKAGVSKVKTAAKPIVSMRLVKL